MWKVCYGYEKCREDVEKLINKMPFVKIDKKGSSSKKYVVITNTIDKIKLEKEIKGLKIKWKK